MHACHLIRHMHLHDIYVGQLQFSYPRTQQNCLRSLPTNFLLPNNFLQNSLQIYAEVLRFLYTHILHADRLETLITHRKERGCFCRQSLLEFLIRMDASNLRPLFLIRALFHCLLKISLMQMVLPRFLILALQGGKKNFLLGTENDQFFPLVVHLNLPQNQLLTLIIRVDDLLGNH